MIVGVGSDLCNIDRIAHSLERFGARFEQRCFTEVEQAKASRRPLTKAGTLAKRFADAAAAQECQTCSSADACIQTYVKATSQAQKEIKQAIRDWKENLDKKASGELFSKGTAALQGTMESQIRVELERLKECLAKIK